MSCITDPISCVVGPVVSAGVGDVASSAWDSICKSFADAATSVLTSFAKAFVAIPDVDLTSTGLRSVYSISLGLAGLVAALLLFGQVIKTAITHDGSAVATGLVGVGKAALAFMLTLSVASTCLLASDELTKWIVDNSFGGTKQFSNKVAKLVAWNSDVSGSLLLIFGLLGILLTVVLWFEMLLRNAAIAVLIATSPISAVGMMSEGTKNWWSKLVTSTVQLIVLKPVVALVFALGFGLAGDSQDLETTLSGMLVLLLAVLAWPSIARFFTWASVQPGGGAGLAALLGFAGGRLSAPGGTGGAGVAPEDFGPAAADRTMSTFASRAGSASAAPGAGAAAGAGPVGAMAAAGVRLAQQAVNSLAGGMDRMAGHSGLQSAPGAQPAGYVYRYGNNGGPRATRSGENAQKPESVAGGQQRPSAPDELSSQPPRGNEQSDLPVAGAVARDSGVTAPASDPPTIEMPPVPSDLTTTEAPAPSAASGPGVHPEQPASHGHSVDPAPEHGPASPPSPSPPGGPGSTGRPAAPGAPPAPPRATPGSGPRPSPPGGTDPNTPQEGGHR